MMTRAPTSQARQPFQGKGSGWISTMTATDPQAAEIEGVIVYCQGEPAASYTGRKSELRILWGSV